MREYYKLQVRITTTPLTRNQRELLETMLTETLREVLWMPEVLDVGEMEFIKEIRKGRTEECKQRC